MWWSVAADGNCEVNRTRLLVYHQHIGVPQTWCMAVGTQDLQQLGLVHAELQDCLLTRMRAHSSFACCVLFCYTCILCGLSASTGVCRGSTFLMLNLYISFTVY